MSEIVVVNPNGLNRTGFSFGIGILAGILQQSGLQVRIVDANAAGLDVSSTAQEVARLCPRIILFTGLWHNFHFLRQVTTHIKGLLPRAHQVAGGWWASTNPRFVLENTAVDYVVKQEADQIISDLCIQLLLDKSISETPGLCYSANDKEYHENPGADFPRNLDALSLPAYHLFDMNYYVWDISMRRLERESLLSASRLHGCLGAKKTLRCCSMYSGRGCYGQCTFCSAANIPRRNYSSGYVVGHMMKMKEEYGVDYFYFNESLTLSTDKWTKEFCREIISRRLNCLYVAQCRGDFAYDEETLNLLRESGCIYIILGVESASDALLRAMRKNINIHQYYNLIRDFQRHKILVSASFILNMPYESLETIDETVNFVKNSGLKKVSVGYASPYPKTELFNFARAKGFIKDDYEYLLNNPARDKGRNNFNAYISRFNFNSILPRKLLSARRRLCRAGIINEFRDRNKFIYALLIVCPFSEYIIYLTDQLCYAAIFLKTSGVKRLARRARRLYAETRPYL